jgi:hypothetical protein
MSPRAPVTPCAASPLPAKGGKTVCPSPFTFEPTVPASLEEAWTPLVDVDWVKEQTGSLVEGYKQLLSHELFLKASLAKIQKDRAIIQSRMDAFVDDLHSDWARFKASPIEHVVDTEAVETWCESVANKFHVAKSDQLVMLIWNRATNRVIDMDVTNAEDTLMTGTWQKDYLMQDGYTMGHLVECARQSGNQGKRMMNAHGKSIIYRVQGIEPAAPSSVLIEVEEGSTICLVRRSVVLNIREKLLSIVDDEKRVIVDETALDTLASEQVGALLAREWSIAA